MSSGMKGVINPLGLLASTMRCDFESHITLDWLFERFWSQVAIAALLAWQFDYWDDEEEFEDALNNHYL